MIFVKSKTNLAVILGMILITAAAIFLWTSKVYANPSQFTSTTQTATATTSPVFMTPGTATSSLVADTFQSSVTGNNYANNVTELLLQFLASSTSSQLNVNLEYSNGYPGVDCSATPSACDWYQDSSTNVNGYATTTLPVSLAVIPQYQWPFASSTTNGVVSSSNNRATRALSINVPTRYVRAVFTCALGGTNCAVWGQFVPQKENK